MSMIEAQDHITASAAALGHKVTATDPTPAMADELRSNAARGGLSLDIRLDDGGAPAFDPQSFDALTSRHFLWTLLQGGVRYLITGRRPVRSSTFTTTEEP